MASKEKKIGELLAQFTMLRIVLKKLSRQRGQQPIEIYCKEDVSCSRATVEESCVVARRPIPTLFFFLRRKRKPWKRKRSGEVLSHSPVLTHEFKEPVKATGQQPIKIHFKKLFHVSRAIVMERCIVARRPIPSGMGHPFLPAFF